MKWVIVVTFPQHCLQTAGPGFAAVCRDLRIIYPESPIRGFQYLMCKACIHGEGPITKEDVPAVINKLTGFCLGNRPYEFASFELLDITPDHERELHEPRG